LDCESITVNGDWVYVTSKVGLQIVPRESIDVAVPGTEPDSDVVPDSPPIIKSAIFSPPTKKVDTKNDELLGYCTCGVKHHWRQQNCKECEKPIRKKSK